MVANIISTPNTITQGDFGTTTGTDTIVATPTPVLAAYVTGALYTGQAGGTNTSTTPTINISSLGAKTIVKRASTALAAGDILSGATLMMRYNGTVMQLLNPVVP